MTADLLNVDQVAQMLSFHTRTIRRLIKEGKLTAVKFGGQWRISRQDLQLMLNRKDVLEESSNIWTHQVEEFLQGKSDPKLARIQVCSVVDCYLSSQAVKELAQKLLDLMNTPDTARIYAKFQYMNFETTGKARFILWGNPSFLTKMLETISKYEEKK
ncbi:MAG: helix-turn-helix domain-containing protein [Candidatus Cloacimonadales bacterium]|nr:helix-turn-helix domain-containing protein [Candidatus Cloacimonadales bacterium]